MTATDTATDAMRVLQVVTGERQARDRGWWEQLPAFYHPEAKIQTSWFNGSIPEYIERSKTMAAKDPSNHRLGQPVVRVNGDRAVAEAPMTIEFRGLLRGVEVDVTVYIRFLHRIERRDGHWRLLASNAVFERDTLTPTFPGAELTIDHADVADFRPSYRMLSLWLTERGHPVGSDRYGMDRPDEVNDLYRQVYGWAGLSVE
ncbi:SnoaL-like domain-containing protein [Nonomuraea maritima]|uniref:SnoaL-like domain-containing protein n=1 Tax=Nonomuraea maritima TaxID=683260 RepID=A0A1G8SKB4_9ACTN|nr:nuclear transport factor 2 family protein [Nonomuraea maritima]SDJ29647.1 SnoaL-like domain-containing protein [Nonomuraea maritima]